MSTHFRCDRCGIGVEHPYDLTYERFQHGQRFLIGEQPIPGPGPGYAVPTLDICDECMVSFGEWLGGKWPEEWPT